MKEKTPLNEELDTTAQREAELSKQAAKEDISINGSEVDETSVVQAEATEENSDKKKKKKAKKSKKNPPEKDSQDSDKKDEPEKKKESKNKPKDVKKAAKRLIKYITYHKALLVVVAIMVILATAVSVFASVLMQPIYTSIGNALSNTIDGNTAMAQIAKSLLIMASFYVLAAAFSFTYTKIMLNISAKTLANMRRDLFNHLETLPISFFDKHKTGEIMSRFTNDVGCVNELVSSCFTSLITAIIQAVMTITIMIIYSPLITLTLTVAIALMFLVVLIITKKCSPLFKKQQKAIGECNGYIEEYIRGIKVVKLFSYETKAKKEFNELNENYRKIGVKANIIGGLMSPLMSMITRINYAVSVSLGAVLVVKGKMTIPALITYLQFSRSYGSPIASIAGCYSTLIAALAGAERVFEVLDTPSETDEGKIQLVKIIKNMLGEDEETQDNDIAGVPSWKIPTDDGFKYVPVKGDINVKDVTFAYNDDNYVIKHVSVEAKGGQKIAFVGSTGAGKTTITNLINRFYEIEQGEITIDGISIKEIKKDDLRHSMSMVLQDTRLFVGTIADNIRYGKLDATDEEIRAAAKLANADTFIEKLPNGYDTDIRSDGANISIGQGQLINIARASIADTPILILDEATSSVDTRTERLIELGMNELMNDRTVFVIAHRLSTVRNSEEIVVLENGEIIESGNHQELIDLNGKYYQLYTGAFEMT